MPTWKKAAGEAAGFTKKQQLSVKQVLTQVI
jgi:hypothetical protein